MLDRCRDLEEQLARFYPQLYTGPFRRKIAGDREGINRAISKGGNQVIAMLKLFRRVQTQVALPPGTIAFAGKQRMDRAKISVMTYGAEDLEERSDATLDDALAPARAGHIAWINVDGLHETDKLERLGEHFGLHPLVLEDIVNVTQRPKAEEYDGYLYIVLKMVRYDEQDDQFHSEQVSIVLGADFVLSFQEEEGNVFEPVRERIRRGKGRIRNLGTDYLAHVLLDAVVDNYFVVLEKMNEYIEALEESVAADPSPEVLREIHRLKRNVIYLRKHARPMRDMASELLRGESELIHDETRPFLRDVYDHSTQVVDAVETFRDMLSGLQDLYLSSVSNRMNEVMKVLTIIATIFVPLTFVAGIYGMNFEHMPELGWRWSYPIFWVVVVAIGGSMIVFFRKKGWI
jgi:magnesium transporter